jgi:hypothetical protein
MDRQQVYALAIPYETDFLAAQRFTQEGLGLLAQDLLGLGPIAAGLACTPTSPASLAVVVGPGRLYQQSFLDASAYGQIANGNPAGGLSADTNPNHQVLKQGLLRDPVTLSCPAPQTSGATVSYLIEAQFQETDTGASVLQFFNTQNPSTPLAGPPNSPGATLPTVRSCACVLQVKAGTPVTSGTPMVPIADAGWVGLYVVTVANGQAAITAGNISVLSGAPFLTQTLPQLGSAPGSYAVDVGTTANTITANPVPAMTGYAVGAVLRILPANASTGPVTANVNGLGAVSVTRPDGTPCVPNDIRIGKAFDVVIKTGPVMQMLSWPQMGDGPKNAIAGAAHAFAVADAGNATWRSNGGAAMTDTLPGAGAGALPAGWAATIINADATGLLAIQVGTGSTLAGPSVSNGYIVLGPGQKVAVTCDGTNYQCFSAFERAKLTANTTLFVSPSGSDTGNVGIVSGSPFASIGRAYSWAQSALDLNSFQLTVSVAPGSGGSYSTTNLFTGPLIGQINPVIINGSATVSTIIGGSSNGVASFDASGGAVVQVQNMSCGQTGAAGVGLLASGPGSIIHVGTGMAFTACALYVMEATFGAAIAIDQSYAATGNGSAHWSASYNGQIFWTSTTLTVTLTGTPSYSNAFAVAVGMANISPLVNGALPVFSGAASSSTVRYSISSNATINTNGAGSTALPGGSTGTGSGYF